MMVLDDGQAETEGHWVHREDNLNKISDDELDQSELIKMFAKHYQWSYLLTVKRKGYLNELSGKKNKKLN